MGVTCVCCGRSGCAFVMGALVVVHRRMDMRERVVRLRDAVVDDGVVFWGGSCVLSSDVDGWCIRCVVYVEDLWGSVLDVLRLNCWFWYGGVFCTVRCAPGLFLVGFFYVMQFLCTLVMLGAWGGSSAWTGACAGSVTEEVLICNGLGVFYCMAPTVAVVQRARCGCFSLSDHEPV